MSRIKLGAAALVAVGSMSLVSACSSPSTESMANKYACSSSVQVTGVSPTWSGVVSGLEPSELVYNDHSSELADMWDRLTRLRNHFAGANSTKLAAGTVILIPRACSKGESAPSVTPTLSIHATP